MPQIMSLKGESKATLQQYGIDANPTDNFGRQCLLARKLAEAGACYIQVSTDYTWDHHRGDRGTSRNPPRPINRCGTDERGQRGLLDDIGALGRRVWADPMVENGNGRNHHPKGFTVWTAGGGVQGGGVWDVRRFWPGRRNRACGLRDLAAHPRHRSRTATIAMQDVIFVSPTSTMWPTTS